MSELKAALTQATKEAMKARDKDRVATLRMVNAELKRIEVDERRDLSDEDVFAVLNKMLKQRKDAMQQFKDASRDDLADIEAYENECLVSSTAEFRKHTKLSGQPLAAGRC